MLSKEEIEKAYWKGYIAKRNEAMEICKQCKYIKKVKQLESDKQKLIEKLEERIKEYKEKSGGNTYHIQSMINAEIRELEWVLSILKGENQVTVK